MVLADDDIRQQGGVGHAFVKRCERHGRYLEGFPVGVLYLELTLENELVADDTADVHLPGNKDKAVGHLRSHLRVVLLVLQLLLEQAAGELLRLFRKTDPLGLLPEEHLRTLQECAAQ